MSITGTSTDDTTTDATASEGWRLVSTPGTVWIHILGHLGGMLLGAVFLVAAWAKALDPAAFAAEVERYGLDFLLPAPAVALIALAIEVLLGGALLLGIRRPANLAATAALVVFFLFLTGHTYYQDVQGTLDEETSCGCFGNLVERTPAEAFWQDLLLMVPALGLAFVGRGEKSAPWPRMRPALITAATLAVVVLAWKAPSLPLDDLATRLRPDADAMAFCAGRDAERVCMDDVLPELAQGEHIVVVADLGDDAFVREVATLNEYEWSDRGPKLWTLHSATEETLFQFQFGYGPAFDLREAPPAMLRPLYRTLPRSFFVRDGRVVETWSGLPPFEQLTNLGR